MIQILLLVLLLVALFLFAHKPPKSDHKGDGSVKSAQILPENTQSESIIPNEQQKHEMEPQIDAPVSDIGFIHKSHSAPEYISSQNENIHPAGTPCSSSKEPNEKLEIIPSTSEKKAKNSRKNTIKGFDFRNKKPILSQGSICFIEDATEIPKETISAKLSSIQASANDQNTCFPKDTFAGLLRDISNQNDLTKKPPLRSKGFNFRISGNLTQRKIANSENLRSNSQSNSLISSPSKQEDNKENRIEGASNIPETHNQKGVKKVRGFNFRNHQKLKLL